jgi:hypothetical protein
VGDCLEVYTSIQTTKYLYDGFDLIAEVDASTGKMTKSYTWDPQVDGGVGRLLSETTYDATGAVNATYLPLADANGNSQA